MSVTDELMEGVTEIGKFDAIALILGVLGLLADTAGINSVYGIDMTQTFAGVSWLTLPVVLIVAAGAYVLVTNAVEFERVTYFLEDEDETLTAELIGVVGVAFVPVMQALNIGFYDTDIVGQTLGLIVFGVGAVGFLFLSSQPNDD